MVFLPLWTISIICLAIIIYLSPTLTATFIYDRQAIIEGELWRLLSGHLVHFSIKHLLYDTIGFGTAGIWIEYRGYPQFGFLCLLMAFVISVTLFIIMPTLSYYGGLSGLASGAIVYLALWGLQETLRWRVLCQGLLIVMSIKISWELWQNTFFLTDSTVFVPVPQSHLIGGLTAISVFVHTQFFLYKVYT